VTIRLRWPIRWPILKKLTVLVQGSFTFINYLAFRAVLLLIYSL
jgi:hypothetical protein